jgi:folate-binding protein YgfZ
MTTNLGIAPLESLAVLSARGPDARKFLQGQLSQDVAALGTGRVALAGFHNPQGRVLAILRLVPLADDALLLVLPGEIAGAIIQRLQRFVLRAKVTLADESAAWLRAGLPGDAALAALAAAGLAPAAPGVGALAARDGRIAWRHDAQPDRYLLLAPVDVGLPAGCSGAADPGRAARDWQQADIAAGLPQVLAATSEAFVAQMLNLDVLGGISFEKGCYTGQEVIARAHYRGRVKRRLQRFRTLAPPAPGAMPGPGASVVLSDGRGARIVDAATLEDGRVEFLAVAALDAAAGGDDDGGSGVAAARPQAESTPLLATESLPLPYALPA